MTSINYGWNKNNERKKSKRIKGKKKERYSVWNSHVANSEIILGEQTEMRHQEKLAINSEIWEQKHTNSNDTFEIKFAVQA